MFPVHYERAQSSVSRKFRVWRDNCDNSCVVPISDGAAPCRPLQQYQLKTEKIVR